MKAKEKGCKKDEAVGMPGWELSGGCRGVSL